MSSKKIFQPETIILDATRQSLGRLASRVALILQGKHKPNFAPNQPGEATVLIKNGDKIKFTGNKLQTKIYYHHTGYIGHLKKITLGQKWEKNYKKVIYDTIKGMLPKNKLQIKRLKRLIIE